MDLSQKSIDAIRRQFFQSQLSGIFQGDWTFGEVTLSGIGLKVWRRARTNAGRDVSDGGFRQGFGYADAQLNEAARCSRNSTCSGKLWLPVKNSD